MHRRAAQGAEHGGVAAARQSVGGVTMRGRRRGGFKGAAVWIAALVFILGGVDVAECGRWGTLAGMRMAFVQESSGVPIFEQAKSLVESLVKNTGSGVMGMLSGKDTMQGPQPGGVKGSGGGGGPGVDLRASSMAFASTEIHLGPTTGITTSMSTVPLGPSTGPTTKYAAASPSSLAPTKGSANAAPAADSPSEKSPVIVTSVHDPTYVQQLLAEEVRPAPPVSEGPLAELMRLTQVSQSCV